MKTFRFYTVLLFFLSALAGAPPAADAKDEWLQVRSKNFFLVGNASEKDIRKVAARLEQFRETFRQVFRNTRVDSPIPTNVVVFKSDSAYKPFKPLRADGKPDTGIAGYFQPGEDVNYITLSVEGQDADTFGTIFHEYVHSIVESNFGKSEVPPWFNEGLAEYYQTFEIEKDIEVKLGRPQFNHIGLLQQNKLIPLETLFKISNYALHQNGNHSRSIFYAQAWALIHYLVQGGKGDRLGKFLDLLMQGVPAEKAFNDTFQVTYAKMEQELRNYVGKSSYQYSVLTFKEKLNFDDQMQVASLGEPESSAYLGDLLYHTNRADDAEALLQNTLAAQPDSSMANTTMGMVRLRQQKWDDAKTYLEKAIAGDQKNHLALYRYAFLLSREGRDEFGYVSSFPKESAEKIRNILKRAIALSPSFTESYELLAFVNLVNNENLPEAVGYLQKALKYQPGNQKYALRVAEIYARQEKFSEASAIASKIAATTSEPAVKSQADNLLGEIRKREDARRQYEAAKAEYEKRSADGPPVMRRPVEEKEQTLEEAEKEAAEATLVSVNQALRRTQAGEIRVLGRIESISCTKMPIVYSIKTDTESFKLISADFQGIALNTFDGESSGSTEVGCDAKLGASLAVIGYRPKQDVKGARGFLVSIEFVPKTFRMMTEKELEAASAKPRTAIVSSGSAPEMEGSRRDAMLAAMKASMRKTADGEKQFQGFIDHAECTQKGTFFFFKTQSQIFKLSVASPQSLQMRAFTPDIDQVRLGCGMKDVAVSVVVTYKDAPDPKAQTKGELVSMEFVPPSFVLAN